MADFHFHGYAGDVVHHNYASVVVLTVVLCECLTTLEDEVQYIWLSPWSTAKCTYLFGRYFSVAYLIANVVFSLVWPPTIPVPHSKCVGWYLQNLGSFGALYIASHITLSKRISERYEVRNVGSALLVFHVAELAGGLFSGKSAVSAVTFNGVCDMFDIPKNVFVFVGMLLLGQLLVWVLILGGFRRRGGGDSSPPDFHEMIYRMWYDGDAKIAWATTCLIIVVNAYRAALNQKVKPVYLFAWPICLLSIGTCRYILSMKRNANIRSSKGNDKGREALTCDDNDGTGELPLGYCRPTPFEQPASTHPEVSNRSQAIRVSYADSFETLSSNNQQWEHPSCLQRISDSNTETANDISSLSSDLTRRTSTSASSSMSTRRRSSVSSRMTQETDITVPSTGAGSSIDIEIGSLHSSSSNVNSEELREFWNEVWTGDDRAFIYA